MTRQTAGGYVDREHLARIRRANGVMIDVVRRIVCEQPLNARLAQQMSRLGVELAEQAQAIGAMEQIRSEL
jgi:hypothetical protein